MAILPTRTEPAGPAVAVPRRTRQARRRRRRRVPLAVALTAVVLPFVATMAVVVWHRPLVSFGGDQAVIELGTGQAAHGHQLLGPYSRYLWSHPGPSWYYLMSLPYRLLGSHSWSLYAGVLLTHLLAGGGIVVAVRRWGGPLLSLVAAALVLGYAVSIDPTFLRAPWNPYALLLTVGLFVVVAASAAAGSGPAVVGCLLVGSFLVQTHVSTAPLVGAVTLLALAVFAVRRWRHRGEPRSPRRSAAARWLVAGSLLLVGMWVPPLVQQVTRHPGNLTEIWRFFQMPHPDVHPLRDGISAAGRELATFPLGRDNSLLPAQVGQLSAKVTAVVIGYLVLAALLVVLARRRADRFAMSLGLLTMAAVPVSAWSAHQVIGPVLDYLVLWISVLPVPLAIGYAALVLPRLRSRTRAPDPARDRVRAHPPPRWALMAAGVAALALSAVQAQRMLTLPALPASSYAGVAATDAAVRAALTGQPRQPVLVRVTANNRWPVMVGLVLQLRKQGWQPSVTDDWVFLAGPSTRARAPEHLEVVLAAARDRTGVPAGARPLGEVGTAVGATDVYLVVSPLPVDPAAGPASGPGPRVP